MKLTIGVGQFISELRSQIQPNPIRNHNNQLIPENKINVYREDQHTKPRQTYVRH